MNVQRDLLSWTIRPTPYIPLFFKMSYSLICISILYSLSLRISQDWWILEFFDFFFLNRLLPLSFQTSRFIHQVLTNIVVCSVEPPNPSVFRFSTASRRCSQLHEPSEEWTHINKLRYYLDETHDNLILKSNEHDISHHPGLSWVLQEKTSE